MKLIRLLPFLFLLACGSTEVYKSAFEAVEDEPGVFVPGVISTADHHESFNTVSDDGRTIYFTRSDKQFETSSLFSSTFINGNWSKPEVLPFSGMDYDAGLTFSSDRQLAFFTSKRDPGFPGISKEWNIWQVAFNNGQWGKPVPLNSPVNSGGQECCLTMNKQGQTFFASSRDGTWDIYQAQYAQGEFRNIKKLSEAVNSENGEWPGYISPDGEILLLSSIRKTGIGGDDLYISKKTGNGWGKPVLLDSLINTASFEDNPRITPDGQHMIFSSWRDTGFSKGMSNIYLLKKVFWQGH